MIRGLLFDLDGVLVNTNPLHCQAWKELAQELGIPFTTEDYEAFLGISRAQCLELLLQKGNRSFSPQEKIRLCDMKKGNHSLSESEKERLCTRKNDRYRELIGGLTPAALLPGVPEFLRAARAEGYRIGLGSVSKNAGFLLQRLEIGPLFDAVIDGTQIVKGKPDPEVFLKGARALNLLPEQCVVFEDSAAGIEAAHRGGMKAVGIGPPQRLPEAELTAPGFAGLTPAELLSKLV